MSRGRLTNIRCSDVRGTLIRMPTVTEVRLRKHVFRILKENVLCSIATVTDVNRAHINTAYFCYSDDLELYFLSHPSSRHSRNLARHSSAGMTIFSSSQPWASPGRGVQLFGRCRQARGAHARVAENLYGERFPAYTGWKAVLKEGDAGLEYRFYRFVVRNLRVLGEKAFGGGLFVDAVVRRGRVEDEPQPKPRARAA